MYSSQKNKAMMEKSNDFKTQVPDMSELNSPPPPPPPYAAGDFAHANNRNTHEKEKSSSTSHLAESSSDQSSSRKLNVCFKGWKSSGIRILDADNETELYTNKCALRKPQMTFSSTATGAVVGTANFHYTKWHIETTIHGSAVKLTPNGITKSRYSYLSPALGGKQMMWKIKSHMFNYDLLCVDPAETVVARFRFSNCSFKKVGQMEVMGSAAANKTVVEEVMVTGLILAEALLALLGIY